MDEFGHNYGRRIRDINFVTADRRVAEAINCPVGTRFLRFINLRTGEDAADDAVVCTKVFINPAYGDSLTRAHAQPETLIVTLIEELFHKSCVSIKQSIRAVALPENVAKLLGAVPGEPALRILRHYLDAKGEALEISVTYHPGRRYAFNMTLGRHPIAAKG